MECCVCFSPYSVTVKPFVGRCGHSICERCVPNLRDPSCPTCRVEAAFGNPAENYLAKELLQHIEVTGSGQSPVQNRPPPRITPPRPLAVRDEGGDVQDLHEILAMTMSENTALQRLVEEFSRQIAMKDDDNNILQEQILSLTETLNNKEMINKELREERDMAQALLESRQQDSIIRRTTEVQDEWETSSSEDDDSDQNEEEDEDNEEDEDSEEDEDETDSDDDPHASLVQLAPHIQRKNVEDCSFM